MSSSYDQFPDIGVDLYDLEAILIDPAIRSLLHKTVAINDEAAMHGGLELARANQIVETLDDELRQLSAMEDCVVTGRLSTYMRSEDQGYIVSSLVEDLPALNRGFTTVPLDLNQSEDADAYVIGLMFEYEDKAEQKLRYGHMMPDEVNSLTVPNVLSLEHSSALLRYYAPEVLQQINDRLLDGDQTDEAATTLRLFDMMIDLDIGGVEQVRLLQAFNVYLEEAIAFDAQVPYSIKVTTDRAIEFHDDSFERVELDAEGMLVQIRRVVFMVSPDDADSSVVLPHVEIDTVCLTKEQPPQRVYVPVVAIEGLASMRRAYYSPERMDQDE